MSSCLLHVGFMGLALTWDCSSHGSGQGACSCSVHPLTKKKPGGRQEGVICLPACCCCCSPRLSATPMQPSWSTPQHPHLGGRGREEGMCLSTEAKEGRNVPAVRLEKECAAMPLNPLICPWFWGCFSARRTNLEEFPACVYMCVYV